MNKIALDELSKIIVEKHKLSLTDAETFVRLMFDTINDGLLNDKLVKIKGLGTFKVNTVKDRESIDVNTGERIVIESRDKINFIPDNVLKDIVNRPFAQFETVELNEGVDFSAIDQKFQEEDDKNIRISEDSQEPEPAQQLQEENTVLNRDQFDSVEENQVGAEGNKQLQPQIVEQTFPAETSPSHQEETKDSHIDIAEQVQTTAQDLKEDSIKFPEDAISQENAEPFSSDDFQENADAILPTDAFTEHNKVEPKHRRRMSIRFVAIFFCVVVVVLGIAGILGYEFGKKIALRQIVYSNTDVQKVKKSHSRIKKVVDKKVKFKSYKNITDQQQSAKVEKEKSAVKTTDAKVLQQLPAIGQTKNEDKSLSKYDSDPRVRTGAYAIVGIDKVVKVRKGQTLSSISRSVLGPGMECYIEAVNGTDPVKENQSIKIPKLILKKKLK